MPAQRQALIRLEDLRRRVLARQTRQSLLQRGLRLLPGKPRAVAPLRGLYLWGGVGRGKTFLVDEFFAELPIREKRREHFHRFMQDVHAGLKRHRDLPSPLAHVAAGIAEQARLLCIDEFVVGDVADAMILAALLEALFARGVTLVATSNLPASELYRGGLQRARFLPAIALIERHCKVLELDGGVDYRLRQLESAPLFLGPDVPQAEARLAIGIRAARGRAGREGRARAGRGPRRARAPRGRRHRVVRFPRTLRRAALDGRLHRDRPLLPHRARQPRAGHGRHPPTTPRAASSRWSTSSTTAASSSSCPPPRQDRRISTLAKGSNSNSAARPAACTK